MARYAAWLLKHTNRKALMLMRSHMRGTYSGLYWHSLPRQPIKMCEAIRDVAEI